MAVANHGITNRRQQGVRLVRDLMRADILNDTFGHEVLPSEPELMLTYRASRGTVRDALDLLRHEGVIERVQGTGTLVRGRRFEWRLIELHGETDPDPTAFATHVLDMREIPAPPVVAQHLDESVGAPCLLLEYIGIAGGEGVGLYTNYLRMPEGEAVMRTPFRGHWYVLMRDAGLAIGSTDLLIDAQVADEWLADRLGIAPGSAILAMQQVIRDESGRPYDFAILRHRGDRLAIKSEARRPVLQGIGR